MKATAQPGRDAGAGFAKVTRSQRVQSVCTHDLGQHCLDLREVQQRQLEAGQEGEQSQQRDRNPHGEKGNLNELSWPCRIQGLRCTKARLAAGVMGRGSSHSLQALRKLTALHEFKKALGKS